MKHNLNTIKNLRQVTGRGLMDCKKALENSDTFDDAIIFLRNKITYYDETLYNIFSQFGSIY